MIKITYQKRNGEIFERFINTYCPYRVGETTSMGWKVLNKEYKYKNNYYSKDKYDEIITRTVNRYKKIDKIKSLIYNVYKHLVYSAIFILFIRLYALSLYTNL